MTPSEQMALYFEKKEYEKVLEIGSEVVHGEKPTPFDLLLFANSCIATGAHKQAYAWFSRINTHPDSNELFKISASAAMSALKGLS